MRTSHWWRPPPTVCTHTPSAFGLLPRAEMTWVGTLHVTIEVGDPRGERFLPVEAVADTGATYTLVPSSLLRELGVAPHRRVPVILGDGRRREWDLGRAWVRVNGQAEPSLLIFGDEGQDPILGAYTLEGLRLAVDPVNRRLIEVPGLLLKAMAGALGFEPRIT